MKPGRKPFVAKDHIKDLNQLKNELCASDEPFLSESRFRLKLKGCNIPYGREFWRELVASGMISKVGEDSYTFSDPSHPIHFATLAGVYFSYAKRTSEYKKNWYARFKVSKAEKSEEVQKAIALLKSYGFEVFVPCGKLFKRM